jgi:hypothetical protein
MDESQKNVQFPMCPLDKRGVRAVLNLNLSSSKSKHTLALCTEVYNNDSGEFRVKRPLTSLS